MRTSILQAFANNSMVASYALWQIRRGRDPRALDELINEPSQVSLAQAQQVANTWLTGAVPSIAISGATTRLITGLGLDARIRRLVWTEDRAQQSKKP
jgi:predicted Zn-dependent peptidase